MEHPNHPQLIFDLPTMDCRRWDCQCGRCELLDIDYKIEHHICEDFSVRIYQDGKLWEPVVNWNGGIVWRNVLPPSLAKQMGDDEWMNDWLEDEDAEDSDDKFNND